MPTTAIYSMSDGTCAWPCCVERPGPLTESIHVPGSHLGLPHNPLVLHVVANRLAQPEGRFSPYPRADMAGMIRRLLDGTAAGAQAGGAGPQAQVIPPGAESSEPQA